jgi:L,D-transpeptidase YcbB
MEVYSTYILNNKAKETSLARKYLTIKLLASYLVCLTILGFAITGCGKAKSSNKGILPDSTIYSQENYSPISLDSSILASFYTKHKIEDSLKAHITDFYTRRKYQYAWFDQNGITETCHIFYNQLQSYSSDFDDLSVNPKLVDSLINFAHDENEKKVLSEIDRQNIELMLTTSYFRYAEKAFAGSTKSTFDLEWFIPRKKKNFQALLDTMISTNKAIALQEPVNQFYKSLIIELRKYKNIEKNGGLPSINPSKKDLKLGDTDSSSYNLKRYLALTGDLTTNDTSDSFDKNLELALKSFQKRHGLAESGHLNKNTLAELNTPTSQRIRQIMINLERLRWLPQEIEPNFILVNIPEFKLHVFENNKAISESNVVVGKQANKTIVFKGELSTIVLNPYWGIPQSIAVKEILPKLKRSTSYLSRNNIEVFSNNKVINPNTISWGKYNKELPFYFRQKPGINNALGKIKFLFPNNYSIYLHDTPSKGLFGETNRAFSHGCIRVQNPKELATYILRNDPKWTLQNIESVLKIDTEKHIAVKPTLPVYILYLTAWVDYSGQLNFRKDLYNFDKKLELEIFASENNQTIDRKP